MRAALAEAWQQTSWMSSMFFLRFSLSLSLSLTLETEDKTSVPGRNIMQEKGNCMKEKESFTGEHEKSAMTSIPLVVSQRRQAGALHAPHVSFPLALVKSYRTPEVVWFSSWMKKEGMCIRCPHRWVHIQLVYSFRHVPLIKTPRYLRYL